jgi:quercetin dioxygenase-like cupin family protein
MAARKRESGGSFVDRAVLKADTERLREDFRMAKTSVGLDAVKVDPKHYVVEDETDRVRIVRSRYGPGEKSEMHSHPDLVAFLVTDGDVRFTYPDGKTEEVHMAAGQTLLMPATTHLPENISDKPFEVLLVELKG